MITLSAWDGKEMWQNSEQEAQKLGQWIMIIKDTLVMYTTEGEACGREASKAISVQPCL